VWWCTPVITALGRLRQDDLEFKARLGYIKRRETISKNKNKKTCGCRWLMPEILATQEAEISRIMVRSQPGQKVHKTLSRKTHHKK
jgi:hypothetical protein